MFAYLYVYICIFVWLYSCFYSKYPWYICSHDTLVNSGGGDMSAHFEQMLQIRIKLTQWKLFWICHWSLSSLLSVSKTLSTCWWKGYYWCFEAIWTIWNEHPPSIHNVVKVKVLLDTEYLSTHSFCEHRSAVLISGALFKSLSLFYFIAQIIFNLSLKEPVSRGH